MAATGEMVHQEGGRASQLLTRLATLRTKIGESTGETSHPVDGMEDSTKPSVEGERGKENTEDVKKNVGANNIESATPIAADADLQADAQPNMGPKQTPIGDDPAAEKPKEMADQGTDVGIKSAAASYSNMTNQQLVNTLFGLAEKIAVSLGQGTAEPQEKQGAAAPAAPATPAAGVVDTNSPEFQHLMVTELSGVIKSAAYTAHMVADHLDQIQIAAAQAAQREAGRSDPNQLAGMRKSGEELPPELMALLAGGGGMPPGAGMPPGMMPPGAAPGGEGGPPSPENTSDMMGEGSLPEEEGDESEAIDALTSGGGGGDQSGAVPFAGKETPEEEAAEGHPMGPDGQPTGPEGGDEASEIEALLAQLQMTPETIKAGALFKLAGLSKEAAASPTTAKSAVHKKNARVHALAEVLADLKPTS